MSRFIALAVCVAMFAAPTWAQDAAAPAQSAQAAPAAEQPVAPYDISDANADGRPIAGTAVFEAFHGVEGVNRIVDVTIDRATTDPRIADIFRGHDIVRLRRTLKEQVCYLLGGPCSYTGRTMQAAHQDMGVQTRDFNILVDHLRFAMDQEHVPFSAQNRLLARLAPMHRDVVQ